MIEWKKCRKDRDIIEENLAWTLEQAELSNTYFGITTRTLVDIVDELESIAEILPPEFKDFAMKRMHDHWVQLADANKESNYKTDFPFEEVIATFKRGFTVDEEA